MEGVYEIQSVHTGRFLNVKGGGSCNGTGLHLWDAEPGVNPHNVWRVCPLGGPAVRGADPRPVELLSVHAQRYLNVAGGSLRRGAEVQLWNRVGDAKNPHNVWLLHPVPGADGVFEIQSAHNGRCLNVRGGNTAQGAELWTWDDRLGVNPHNLWRFVPSPAPSHGAMGVGVGVGVGAGVDGGAVAAPECELALARAPRGPTGGRDKAVAAAPPAGSPQGPLLQRGPLPGECVVCLEGPACVALLHGDTAHLCVCTECCVGMTACPLCRRDVSGSVRVYTA